MRFMGIPLWAVAMAIAGSAGVLAILHLLRVRPRGVRVITTLFWSRAVEQPRARTLLHRFRHPRTYALLLLICALLSAALGMPHWPTDSAQRVWEVIILDGGASMSAPHLAAGTRFETGLEAVRIETERLSLDDRVAIVIADPWPRLVHGFDDPRPMVHRRLAGTSPATLPAAQDAAFRLARSLLQGRPNPRVVWITDRPEDAAPPDGADPTIELRVEDVGEPADNAAIVLAMFEPDSDDPLRGRFVARLAYWGKDPRTVNVTVRRAGGAPLLNETHSFVPGGTHDFVVANLPADGDDVIVTLSPQDAVMADDHAVFRLPLRAVMRVGIEGDLPDALWIALESDPSVVPTGSGEECDVDVFAGPWPVELSRPSIAVPESGVPIAPSPVHVVGRSSLTESLGFEDALCGGGASLSDLGPGAKPLLTANGAVLAAISSSGGTECLYLAPALVAEGSQACRRGAFAVLVARAVRRLAGWHDLPVALAAERSVQDPLWGHRTGHVGDVIVLPGSRRTSDLSRAMFVDTPRPASVTGRWAFPAPFEIMLAMALALFVAEAVLHTRGRIP